MTIAAPVAGATAVQDASGSHRASHGWSRRPRGAGGLPYAVRAVAVVLPVAFGIVERLWFLSNTPINSDQAVVGLMARGILEGHQVALFWGQAYGGVEPYVVAAIFLVFGQSALTLNLASVMLSAVAALLVWRIARRLVHDRFLALMAGVLVWAAPETSGYLSTLEYGFRGVTLALGLGLLLLALRVLDRRASIGEYAALGLLLGIGWWSSPEIAYFAVPAGLVVGGACALDARPAAGLGSRWRPTRPPSAPRRSAAWWPALRPWLVRAAIVLATTIVGALPWIWANARDGWLSIHKSSFGGGAQNGTYAERFANLFHQGLAVTLGMSRTRTELPVLAPPWDHIVWVLGIGTCALAFLLCVARGGRALAVATAVLAFPLIWAYSPATGSTATAVYGVFLPPLLALVLVVGFEEGAARAGRWAAAHAASRWRQRPVGQLLMVGLVAGVSIVALVGFVVERQSQSLHDVTGNGATPASRGTGPGGANALAVEAVNGFRRAGITDGYASYWVAYKLDFLSGAGARPGLLLTPISTSTCRNQSILRTVDRSRHPAWVFVDPRRGAAAVRQYLNPPIILQGPGQESIPLFSHYLAIQHERARVVRAGALESVVPARRVEPTQVGFAPASECRIRVVASPSG